MFPRRLVDCLAVTITVMFSKFSKVPWYLLKTATFSRLKPQDQAKATKKCQPTNQSNNNLSSRQATGSWQTNNNPLQLHHPFRIQSQHPTCSVEANMWLSLNNRNPPTCSQVVNRNPSHPLKTILSVMWLKGITFSLTLPATCLVELGWDRKICSRIHRLATRTTPMFLDRKEEQVFLLRKRIKMMKMKVQKETMTTLNQNRVRNRNRRANLSSRTTLKPQSTANFKPLSSRSSAWASYSKRRSSVSNNSQARTRQSTLSSETQTKPSPTSGSWLSCRESTSRIKKKETRKFSSKLTSWFKSMSKMKERNRLILGDCRSGIPHKPRSLFRSVKRLLRVNRSLIRASEI